jgi:hypothetical protein
MAEAMNNNVVQMQEAPRKPEVDERRLINSLEANLIEADTIQGNEVSEQRRRNHEYYALNGLGNEKKGRSQHLSADVLDAVESGKSFYMEAFGGNRRPLRFYPENGEDRSARLSTEYVTDMFLEDNEGFSFLRDALHDAFVAKRCVAHLEWCDHTEEGFEDFQGPEQQFEILAGRPEVIDVEDFKYIDMDQGMVSARIVKEIDRGYAKLDLLQPESFFRDGNVSNIKDAAFAGWVDDITRGDLIERGFDPDEVMNLRLDWRLRRNEEDYSRRSHDGSWSRNRRMKRSPEMEEVTLYTHYAWMDLSNYAGDTTPSITDTRLYKFYWSQGELLTNPDTGEKWQEITDGVMPFHEWVQYKISHAEHGMCDADVTASVQWDKSNLRRLIIDNVAMGNTSRWKAKHSFIKNPRELLENKIGSVLWVKEMDALEPLQTPPINPITFSLEEKLDQEKENRTGMSRLAKGMSGDAVSHQNADTMIMRLTNASNRRVLRGVRDFAETFIKPIFVRMHNLGVRNDRRERMVTLAGQMIPFVPTMLPIRRRMRVSSALTPDEGREEAMFLLQMHQVMAADPEIGALYTADKRFQLMTDVFDCYGWADAMHYMRSPGDPQVQQMKQMNAEMQKMQQQLEQMQVQLVASEQQRKWAETQNKLADVASDNLREDEELDFERKKWREEFEFKKYMDEKELELEKTQARNVVIGR